MPNAATVTPNIDIPGSSQPCQSVRRELRRRLLALPYRAFLRAAVHLLHAQGYTTARPAGRDHWKGRNTAGGWDAEADFEAGALGTLRCIAQVKQFDALTVAQRHVDEIRGTCLRAGAHQALLITLSTFSPPARKAARSNAGVAPVRLIDGDELLDILIESGLGVRRGRGGAWTLDEDYFSALSEPAGLRGAEAGPEGRARALSVTIHLGLLDGCPRAGTWHWMPGTPARQDLNESPDGGPL